MSTYAQCEDAKTALVASLQVAEVDWQFITIMDNGEDGYALRVVVSNDSDYRELEGTSIEDIDIIPEIRKAAPDRV